MTTEENGFTLTRKVFEPVESQFTPGERSMVAWISTDAVDHERDVVVSSGIDYKTYFMGKTPEQGNPCVLAFHDLGRWPLGRCEWVKIKQSDKWNGLYAKTIFDDDPETEAVWRKIKSRSLRGISIGFRPPDDLKPGEWGPPTREELLRRPDWKTAERVIRRCVLLEYSVCSLPMNPQALVAAVNKGVHRPVYSLPKAIKMDDADYREMVEAARVAAKTIKHSGDYGTLYAHKADAALHWTMADGDGGDGLDTSKMIEEKLGAVPGVKKVQIGDEWSPREEEGWEQIFPESTEAKSLPCSCGKSECKECAERMQEHKAEGEDEREAESTEATETVEPAAKAAAESEPAEAPPEPEPSDPDDFDEDDEDDEAALPIKTGDHVDVKSRHFHGCGVVEKIHRKGLVDHVDEDMIGTKDDPAARVRLYKQHGDGHKPSDQRRPFKLKELARRAERFKEPSKKSLAKTSISPIGETSAPAPTPEPLPTIVVKSDQEVRAELIAKLNEMLSPEGFRKIAREEAERAAGFV